MPLIAVVDDDISVRESLDSLLRSAGLAVRVYTSAEEFLNSDHHCDVNCLIRCAAAGDERVRAPP